MVYPFFSKWKELKSDLFSVEKEIKTAEKVYRLKVRLFKRILDKLEDEKIDIKSGKILVSLYKKYPNTYEKILQKLLPPMELKMQDIDSFYELSYRLKKSADRQRELAEKVLFEIVEKTRYPDRSKLYEIRDLLKTEGEYLMQEEDKFKKIEQVVLIINEPGPKPGTYLRIFDAVKSGAVKYDKNKLWVDGKEVQGVRIIGNKIIIKGDHYTAEQNAKWIQGDRYVNPSMRDPYSYFVERGKLERHNRREIQKILGVPCAEAVVSLEIEIFPEQLHVRIMQGYPIKFAVNNLAPDQVVRVHKEARLVAV
jgi:hypothetical protein